MPSEDEESELSSFDLEDDNDEAIAAEVEAELRTEKEQKYAARGIFPRNLKAAEQIDRVVEMISDGKVAHKTYGGKLMCGIWALADGLAATALHTCALHRKAQAREFFDQLCAIFESNDHLTSISEELGIPVARLDEEITDVGFLDKDWVSKDTIVALLEQFEKQRDLPRHQFIYIEWRRRGHAQPGIVTAVEERSCSSNGGEQIVVRCVDGVHWEGYATILDPEDVSLEGAEPFEDDFLQSHDPRLNGGRLPDHHDCSSASSNDQVLLRMELLATASSDRSGQFNDKDEERTRHSGIGQPDFVAQGRTTLGLNPRDQIRPVTIDMGDGIRGEASAASQSARLVAFAIQQGALVNPLFIPRGLGQWAWLRSGIDDTAAENFAYEEAAEITPARLNGFQAGEVTTETPPVVVWLPNRRYLNPVSRPDHPGSWEYYTPHDAAQATNRYGGDAECELDEEPTAQDVWEAKCDQRLSGADFAAEVNIVWVPDEENDRAMFDIGDQMEWNESAILSGAYDVNRARHGSTGRKESAKLQSFLQRERSTSSRGNSSHADYWEPTFEDAVEYIARVKAQFEDRPDVVTRFVQFVQEHKGGTSNTAETFSRIRTLFAGHLRLVRDFGVLVNTDGPVGANVLSQACINSHPRPLPERQGADDDGIREDHEPVHDHSELNDGGEDDWEDVPALPLLTVFQTAMFFEAPVLIRQGLLFRKALDVDFSNLGNTIREWYACWTFLDTNVAAQRTCSVVMLNILVVQGFNQHCSTIENARGKMRHSTSRDARYGGMASYAYITWTDDDRERYRDARPIYRFTMDSASVSYHWHRPTTSVIPIQLVAARLPATGSTKYKFSLSMGQNTANMICTGKSVKAALLVLCTPQGVYLTKYQHLSRCGAFNLKYRKKRLRLKFDIQSPACNEWVRAWATYLPLDDQLTQSLYDYVTTLYCQLMAGEPGLGINMMWWKDMHNTLFPDRYTLDSDESTERETSGGGSNERTVRC